MLIPLFSLADSLTALTTLIALSAPTLSPLHLRVLGQGYGPQNLPAALLGGQTDVTLFNTACTCFSHVICLAAHIG
jgi:hypothetical protein